MITYHKISTLLLTLLIAFSSNAQQMKNFNYDKAWKEVEKHQKKGLTRSALEEVDNIYLQAKSEGVEDQLIKALIYKIGLQRNIEEKSDTLTIALLEAEIRTSKAPAQQILQSILANIYWNYYQNQRWQIMERTDIARETATDFQTWDAKQFHRAISDLYLASIQPKKSLQKVNIRDFDLILTKGKNSEKFRPTLYDFLAHRTLDYFSNTEAWVTEPGDKFEMKAEEVLVSISEFLKLKLESEDIHSRHLQLLKVYQGLLDFHSQKGEVEPLLDAELSRLAYLREHAIGNDVDTLYHKALENLAETYSKHEMSAEVQFVIASLYNQRANNYKSLESDAYQWDRRTALNICKETIKKYPQSRGAQQCKALQANIESFNLSLSVENINVPKQPFRARLAYKNLTKVYFRVIADAPNLFENRNAKQTARKLAGAPILESWSEVLTDEGDCQEHSTEIKVPALESGNYVLLVSDNEDFSINKHALIYARTQVGNLSFVYRQEEDKIGGFVIHRETGEPLENVAIQPQRWVYQQSKYIPTDISLQTDKNGYFSFPISNDYNRYMLEMRWKDEYYKSNVIYGYNYGNRVDREQTVIHFFTDRKIYRPGQTIYFKAIVLNRWGESHSILPDHKFTVELQDVNAQKVGEHNLTTNEYGTAQGSFAAPTGGLLGQMYLRTDYGRTNFSVEEYKRPKFEVVMNPVEGSYSLGDVVNISGKAKAYSGANIDGAKVVYRITRQARFPYWFSWWRPMPQSPAREIANGEMTTDENGDFAFDFSAIPDESIEKSSKPIFTYNISVDVVDISGETQSGSVSVRAGYVGLDINIDIANKIDANDPGTLNIDSKNLNGNPEMAIGTLNISLLKSPKAVIRARRWEQVDRHVLSQKVYKETFPHDVYAQENEPRSWEVEKTVLTRNFNTDQAKEISLDVLKDQKAGWYKLELKTADNEIEIIKYFQVYDPDSKRIEVPQILEVYTSKDKAEPGETVVFNIASAERKVWVLYELEKNGNLLERRWVNLKRNKEEVSIPIKEAHRGNLTASFSVIRHNEFQAKKETIVVPWTNKELKLEWMTFRSELLPGQKEQWKLKISGPKGEEVASEMVATLYDASLDAFRSNSFGLNLYPTHSGRLSWNAYEGFSTDRGSMLSDRWNPVVKGTEPRLYDGLINVAGLYFGGGYGRRGRGWTPLRSARGNYALEEIQVQSMAAPAMQKAEKRADIAADSFLAAEEEADDLWAGIDNKDQNDTEIYPGSTEELSEVPIRTNLNETAFFFPQLETNAEGEIVLDFTIPEALTRWKFLGLAHTKDLEIGTIGGETITKKDLMVVPNVPRFFREGDKMTFTAKVVNLSEKELTGVAEFKLLDAFNMNAVAEKFDLGKVQQKFTVPAGQSTVVSWEISIPEDVDAVATQVIAKAGDFSDGEENIVPILKNRMMVTESLPLAIRGNQTKEFSFKKLVENNSSTLSHQKLTLEFTSNPAWYAVQSLPYLMEYPYDCTEQIFSRFYANALSTHVANSSPKTRQVFEQWRKQSMDATLSKQSLLSNLEQNQELKAVLLEETPWLLNARNESERKRRVGLLFDINRMSDELSKARRQLNERQNGDGSFSWFPGMPSSRYITQLIVTGMGHLQKLGVGIASGNPEISQMVSNALPYLDRQIQRDLENLKKYKADLSKDHLSSTQIQYLYMRSFFADQPLARGSQEAFDYYFKQAQQYWLQKSHYMQGMLSLALARYEDRETSTDIIASLKENAVFNEELGMYWKQPEGYYWYQAPIEQQSLLIEAFAEVTNDIKAVEEMKIWLLKNKQTNDWKSTRATVAACNALLSQGTDWLENEELVDISLGNMEVDPNKRPDTQAEAGTGYFKTAWIKDEVKEKMGNVTVSKKDDGIAWGALYWQYFEQMDKITYASTPLSIQKQLFIENNTKTGPQLTAISKDTPIGVGDKVVVRIELRVDRDMEYVHMKDMRAAAFEPLNILSQYKYKNGLGYYESTKDASTNFFFEYLRKGTHVFEYPLRATQKGDFSNGITSIQCMYAPEFTSHSAGIRVEVK